MKNDDDLESASVIIAISTTNEEIKFHVNIIVKQSLRLFYFLKHFISLTVVQSFQRFASNAGLAVRVGAADGLWQPRHVPHGHRLVHAASSDRTGRSDTGQQAEGVEGDLDLGARADEQGADGLGVAEPTEVEL